MDEMSLRFRFAVARSNNLVLSLKRLDFRGIPSNSYVRLLSTIRSKSSKKVKVVAPEIVDEDDPDLSSFDNLLRAKPAILPRYTGLDTQFCHHTFNSTFDSAAKL